MAFTIFYSWQSDIPKNINRNFIENALKKAIHIIKKDITVQEAMRDDEILIDKDTSGVPGTPAIADIILEKISRCGIFACDLTFVGNTKKGRPLPNPNVLIEYGWALNAVTYARIISIMNAAYGEPNWNTLPFNMRHRRFPITYKLKEGTSEEERSKIKEDLTEKLVEAIKLILSNNPEEVFTADIKYIETPFTTKPSIFLKPGEQFLEEGIFHPEGNKQSLPDNQHLFLRIIPPAPGINIKSSLQALKLAEPGDLRPLGDSQGW